MQSLILPMRAWGISPAEIEYDDYSGYRLSEGSNKESALRKLESLQVNCKYKTIVFDSVTSGADAITREIGKQKQADGDKGKKVGGINVSSIEDFNAEDAAFKEILALLKSISAYHNCHVIIIAHVIGNRDKKEGQVTSFARIICTGGQKISAKLPAYCTEIYHFTMKTSMDMSADAKYSLFTTHTGDDFARTALPLDKEIIFGNDPLYDKFLLPAIKRLNGK